MSFPKRSPTEVSDEGRRARERGDPAAANPYPEGSEDHTLWKRSWETPDEGGPPSAEPEAPA